MTINCKGKLLDLTVARVMGILNITPDSFYDGGNFLDKKIMLSKVEKMLNEGATFIDVGGYSSRPGAKDISVNEELQRVVPVVEAILEAFPQTLVSIDTFRSEVAKVCLDKGAALINDISAGHLDPNMIEVVAEYQAPFIGMHMKGTPQTMQKMAVYEDMLKEIQFYFSELANKARKYRLNDLIIDPGFGFAKTTHQNFHLLNNLELLKLQELPLLVGLSRKSMIYKTLNTTAQEALNGTTSLNSIALLKGANILRVHDVKEAVDCITLVQAMKSSES